MRNYQFFVYILTNKYNNYFYVGVTNNLERRMLEHRAIDLHKYACRKGINKLIYYDEHQYINNAIHREKILKKWKRQWKINLINQHNPQWRGLHDRPSSLAAAGQISC